MSNRFSCTWIALYFVSQAFHMGHYPVYFPTSPPAVPMGMVPAIPMVSSMIGSRKFLPLLLPPQLRKEGHYFIAEMTLLLVQWNLLTGGLWNLYNSQYPRRANMPVGCCPEIVLLDRWWHTISHSACSHPLLPPPSLLSLPVIIVLPLQLFQWW